MSTTIKFREGEGWVSLARADQPIKIQFKNNTASKPGCESDTLDLSKDNTGILTIDEEEFFNYLNRNSTSGFVLDETFKKHRYNQASSTSTEAARGDSNPIYETDDIKSNIIGGNGGLALKHVAIIDDLINQKRINTAYYKKNGVVTAFDTNSDRVLSAEGLWEIFICDPDNKEPLSKSNSSNPLVGTGNQRIKYGTKTPDAQNTSRKNSIYIKIQ